MASPLFLVNDSSNSATDAEVPIPLNCRKT